MKNKEIERKFLIQEENLPGLSKMTYTEITQGYMQNISTDYIYRLRQCFHFSPDSGWLGEQYFQTIKGKGSMIREEFEIEFLKSQFIELWPLCKDIAITKKRYEIEITGQKGHGYLDVYKNNLKGLYTIEVEFDNEMDCRNFVKPSWFGLEVTEDYNYTNLKLAMNGLPVDFRNSTPAKNEFNLFIDSMARKYESVCRGGKDGC